MKGKSLMTFKSDERIALFIDGANLHSAIKALDLDIDYKKMREYFDEKANLIRVFYYTAIIGGAVPSPISKLVDWLDYNGYTMVTKQAKELTNENGQKIIKGNMDVEITIDVMEMLRYLDHIILVSGDGDFRRLIETAQRNGKRVTVLSTAKSDPPIIADELRRQTDYFIELDELRDSIGSE